jgi:hypothetical protein
VRRLAVLARGLSLGFAVSVALAVAAPSAGAEPPTTHEIIYTRPSGFWTSNRPAVDGAYRWRLLGLGVVIAAVTGYGMLRLGWSAAPAPSERAGGSQRDPRGCDVLTSTVTPTGVFTTRSGWPSPFRSVAATS